MGLEPTSRDIKEGIVKSDNLKSASLAGKSAFYQLNYPPQDWGRAKEVAILSNEVPHYAQHFINSLGLPIWNFDLLLC